MRGCRPSGTGRQAGFAIIGIIAGMMLSADAAQAEQQALQVEPPSRDHEQLAYHYRIDHARYGDIGTYVNVVTRRGDDTEVQSEMHVTVKMLGIVMFREDARRTEYWHGNRLVTFHGTTVTNGTRVDVNGEAQGGDFVVTNGSTKIVAPGNVHPSNPWSSMVLDTDAVMSTKTGEVFKAQVKGGAVEQVTFDGNARRLRQYEVLDDKREFVWFDERGIPEAFRVFQDGSTVDFILTH
jgi:hypothetical protein